MTRAYLRLDPGFFERKALDQNYPLAAVAALIGCLCLADSQPSRGEFRSLPILKVLLGAQAARWVQYLVDHRDLVVQARSGRVRVEGWDVWQEGDLSVPERMKRYRARIAARDASVSDATPAAVTSVTSTDTPPVTAPRQGRGAGSLAGAKAGSVAPSRATRPSSTTDQDDDQPGEAEAYQLLGRRPTARQRSMLRSIADQERTSRADVASGWAVVTAWIRTASKAEDALATVRTAAATARRQRREATVERPTTPVGPVHPGLAAVASELASGMSMSNGRASSVSRERALEQLRSARGLVVEPAWSALLAKYGLTEADLDEAKP